MNETLDTIYNRRAIRHYTSKQISDDQLQQILKAALHAPNAMNKQNWHFTVIQNKELMNKLSSLITDNIINLNIKPLIKMISHPAYDPFYNAPTVIFISGNDQAEFVKIETGAAAQNIALAAESLGLGSCVITMPMYAFASQNAEELKKYLGIPEGYSYICSVVLGYTEGELPDVPLRNTDVINYIK
jgi:nitroreductase